MQRLKHSAMSKKERWIAGIDLTPRSRGVVRFCRWLATRRDRPERSIAVHVVDSGLLGHIGLHTADEGTLGRATEATRAYIAEHGELSSFERVTAVEGDAPSETLEAARIFHHARGIVVGRNERPLGRVTRRLLSAPTGTIAVVPSNFEVPAKNVTIVCCCSLDAGEGQSVQVAQQLAARFGASLSLLHVQPRLDAASLYMSGRALDDLATLRREEAQRELARLAARHELGNVERLVVPGSFVTSVLAFAEQKRACMVVCGTRQRHGLDKVRSAGRSLELTQAASIPVLVVPSA